MVKTWFARKTRPRAMAIASTSTAYIPFAHSLQNAPNVASGDRLTSPHLLTHLPGKVSTGAAIRHPPRRRRCAPEGLPQSR